MTDKNINLDMRGRFHLYYDYDTNQYWFAVAWGHHTCKRIVTEEQLTVLERILEGGYIEPV